MAVQVPFLDCCGQPALDFVRCWVRSECGTVSLRVCRGCGAHWYFHLKEYGISSDAYDRRSWYVRVTEEEAQAFAQSDEPPSVRLFAEREGIARTEDGIQKMRGIPDFAG